MKNINWAIRMVEEYGKSKEILRRPPRGQPWSEIKRAIDGDSRAILVFTDASFEPDRGRSACGLILIDGGGVLLGFKVISLGILDSVLEAEMVAIKLGLEEAKNWNCASVKLFPDCQEALDAIADKKSFWGRGGYTLSTIWNELRS